MRCYTMIVSVYRPILTLLYSFRHSGMLLFRPVVLNLFYMSYPFIKEDYKIYPQYTQW